jgi:hypothetical protein
MVMSSLTREGQRLVAAVLVSGKTFNLRLSNLEPRKPAAVDERIAIAMERRPMRRVAALLLATGAITLGVAPSAAAHEPPGCGIAHEAAGAHASDTAHANICRSV